MRQAGNGTCVLQPGELLPGSFPGINVPFPGDDALPSTIFLSPLAFMVV